MRLIGVVRLVGWVITIFCLVSSCRTPPERVEPYLDVSGSLALSNPDYKALSIGLVLSPNTNNFIEYAREHSLYYQRRKHGNSPLVGGLWYDSEDIVKGFMEVFRRTFKSMKINQRVENMNDGDLIFVLDLGGTFPSSILGNVEFDVGTMILNSAGEQLDVLRIKSSNSPQSKTESDPIGAKRIGLTIQLTAKEAQTKLQNALVVSEKLAKFSKDRSQPMGIAAFKPLVPQPIDPQTPGRPSVEIASTPQVSTPSVSPPAKPIAPAVSAVPKSDVDTVIVGMGIPSRHAYAIVVGVEQYQQQLPQADYARHDAEIMGQYLTQSLGYAEENVVVLLNERATKTNVEKYVEGWLPDRVEAGDSVFIYFSGHGAPNAKTGKAYLVPYDGDPAFIEKTGYPLDHLYDSLAALPAKEVVVMLDSCFSGAGGRSVIAEGMRPMVLAVENPVLAKGKIVVLAASSGAQISSTYKQQGHGLLTYFFLKGLRGEGDRNRDGHIELSEVFEYLKPQVERTARREFHNEQTPQLLGNPEILNRGIQLLDHNVATP